ncbi:uncharacterized protein QC761_110450 [Podospora bellae-mahoneyi]|uniref:RRM domain-containing protein n=1 Tax=Podospora bellae-mahoneyi TaxID=2093777 RepID=A0ABR0FYF6_9PEZI|nr:hypothetical protein QC761_110450 [Podospora bellae-mahoneyi]
MERILDRSLDEILADRKQNNRGGNRGNRGGNSSNSRDGRLRRRDNNNNNNNDNRSDYPRDGVRKSFRDEAPRNLDTYFDPSALVKTQAGKLTDSAANGFMTDMRIMGAADLLREDETRTSTLGMAGYHGVFYFHVRDSRGSKIRVDNIHYELTQEELEGLFSSIGPLVKLEMKYDRAGRSEGTAFVTYQSSHDAAQAIKEFDGANAAGQPIRLAMMPTGPRRNPFDTAINPRPLAERITVPSGRSRSLSPHRQSDEEAARKGIDRYRPGASRSRSPMPPRRREGGGGGRRQGGGGRRERGGGKRDDGGRGGGEKSERRPKKTQEELDAEMEDYFGGGGAQQNDAAPAANGAAAQQQTDGDIDMIE